MSIENKSALATLEATAPTEEYIVRIVRNIQRTRKAAQAIADLGRDTCIYTNVLATMPVGQGPEEVELRYFKLGRLLSPKQIAVEFENRNMDPDPQALIADVEQDPVFADEHPSEVHWHHVGNMSSRLTFRVGCFAPKRFVNCARSDNDCQSNVWLAGVVRK